MKAVSNNYKEAVKEMGKQISTKIDINDYDSNNELVESWTITDSDEFVNSISYNYDGQLYKSIMKQLILDINRENYDAYIMDSTTVRREITVYFGIYIESTGLYEYINLGNYIIKDIETQEDTNSYRITMYDKMLYSMVDYEGIDIKNYVLTTDTKYEEDTIYYKLEDDEYIKLIAGEDYNIGDSITGDVYINQPYPITLRDYIKHLCDYLGIGFANENDSFANYDKELTTDLYINDEGEGIGYTFRDVLDDIAEATGRTIIIDGNNLKLTATPTTSVATIDEESLKDINVEFGERFGPINALSLGRSADSDIIYRPLSTDTEAQQSIETYGKTEIRFTDNQLLSQDDRGEWIDEIFDEIFGTEYYINNYSSPGITYLEPLDRYNVSIDSNIYNCLMLSDEINITQGLEENVRAETLEKAKTDYTSASEIDKLKTQTTLIVNKQLNKIVGEVATKTDIDTLQGAIDANGESITNLGSRVEQNEEKVTTSISRLNNIEENGVSNVSNTMVTIDINGITVATNQSEISTVMKNDSFIIKNYSTDLAKFNNDGAYLDNLRVNKYFVAGNHRVEKTGANNERTGWFYIGG